MARKSDMEDTESPQPPDPMEVMARLASALEALSARQTQAPDDRIAGLMEKLSEALVRVSESNIEGSRLIADETRRAHRPSNEVNPGVSVFNRRGDLLEDYKKPKLKCLMMLPWLAEWESLTREEVELLNLLQPGEYQIRRIDNSRVRCTIQVAYKVDGITPSTLIINHDTAFNQDNFRLMPSLADMLRQVLKQHEPDIATQSRAVMTDEEEEALIEAGELSVSA